MRYALMFLHGPLLYAYFRSLVDQKRKIRNDDFLHLIPAVLVMILGMFFLSGSGKLVNVIRYSHFLIYCLFVLKSLKKAKSQLSDRYSSTIVNRYNWIGHLTLGFITTYGLFLIHYIYHIDSSLFYIHPAVPMGLFFLLANWIVLKGLMQPELFIQTDELSRDTRYAKSSLTTELKNKYLDKMHSVMTDDRLFLNPDLTLYDLSRATGISENHLSQLLNMEVGANFYNFINRYRIDESKRLLDANLSPNIMEICLESGFNSKSVFNAAFRKFTGTSPSQYLKNTR